MAAEALLFDLDGTIWDSYPCYAAALSLESELTEHAAIRSLRSGDNVIGLVRGTGLTPSRFLREGVPNSVRGLSDGSPA